MHDRGHGQPRSIGLLASILMLTGVPWASGDEPVRLAEASDAGRAVATTVTLDAAGRFIPESKPGAPSSVFELKVRNRLRYVELPLTVEERRVRRSLRLPEEAEATIEGEEPIRSERLTLRPEIDRIVAELDPSGDPVVASPGGPLTRSEFELVQTPADPLLLPDLLPDRPVAVGDRWAVPDAVVRSLTGYDAIATNGLEASATSIGDAEAEVALEGRVTGAALGGRGVMDLKGSLTFGRNSSLIQSLRLERAERREPGPVEAGLEFQSRLLVERSIVEPPEGAAAIEVPGTIPEDWLLLRYNDPTGRYRLDHDRDWYVFSEDDRQTILRRLDRGNVVAQCNLVAGPTVEPGAAPKPDRFRQDIQKALGERFDAFEGVGPIDAPDGETRLRLSVKGHQGDEPIIWYYYMVSGPSGEQLVAAFTLRGAEADRFGRRDRRMIGSLRWLGADR